MDDDAKNSKLFKLSIISIQLQDFQSWIFYGRSNSKHYNYGYFMIAVLANITIMVNTMYIIDLNLLLMIILCLKTIEISRFKIEISRFQFWNLEIANFDSRDLKLKSRDSKFKTELRSR